MARPSKLTDDQLAACQRRHIDGESIRSLAKEFGVSASALRERISVQSAQIKTVANQIVAAERALSVLPVSAQITAQTYASKLRAMGDNMLSAASLNAATSHRLAAIANAQVSKVDDADPMASADVLKSVAALTEMSNRSGEQAMKLIVASSKDGGMKPPGEDQDRRLAEMSDDELAIIATGGA